MAWYDVTYSCGHVEKIQLYGPNKERQRKIEWYRENKVCSDCYKKQCMIQNQKVAEKYGWSDLQGSEKQISWAMDIRNNVWNDMYDKFKNYPDDKIEQIRTAVGCETSAKVWIDNRYNEFVDWIKFVRKYLVVA